MNIFIIALLLYSCVLGFLYIYQRSLLYFPDQNIPDPAAWNAQNHTDVAVKTADGLTLNAWYFPPTRPEALVVVLFHGNGFHFAGRMFKAPSILSQGLGLLLAEYRGYGGNPGKPSEQGLYKDARAYIDWLVKEQNIKPEQVILYGESLGTGVAVQMATEYPVKGVILESAYSALPDIAKKTYFFVPVNLLMKDQYRSIDKIKNVRAPLLFIHGDRDTTIPITHARRLFEAANEPKSFIAIPNAGHNDLYDHGAPLHVGEFLRNITKQKE